MLLKEAVEDFLLSGMQAGWSRATVKLYRFYLEHWRLWLDDRAVMRVDQVTRRLLRAWGAGLRYQHWPAPLTEDLPEVWQPATVRLAVIALKSFYSYCVAEHYAEEDLGQALTTPRVPKRMHRTIWPDEVLALLEATQEAPHGGVTPDQGAAVCLRNAAIVSLLYDSLLRNAELCRLSVGNVDLERRRLTVVIKGGNEEKARFSEETAERLAAWLAVREPAPGVDTVFVSIAGATPGHPLTTTGLRIVLRNLGNRAGVANVSPHAFRRGGACQLTRMGAPSRAVQEFARWSDIKMVELYTRALDSNDVYDDYSPVHSLGQEEDLADLAGATKGANRKPKR